MLHLNVLPALHLYAWDKFQIFDKKKTTEKRTKMILLIKTTFGMLRVRQLMAAIYATEKTEKMLYRWHKNCF